MICVVRQQVIHGRFPLLEARRSHLSNFFRRVFFWGALRSRLSPRSVRCRLTYRSITHPIPSHPAYFAGCQRLEIVCRQGEIRRGDRPRRREPSCEGVGRAGGLERDRWAPPEHVHRGGWASPASEPAQVRLGWTVVPSALLAPVTNTGFCFKPFWNRPSVCFDASMDTCTLRIYRSYIPRLVQVPNHALIGR